MSAMNIIHYDFRLHDPMDEFREVLHHLEFIYNTGHLAIAGVLPADINIAVSNAMKVCKINNVDPADHFKSLYVFSIETGVTYCEWVMSRQGFALVVMNAPHTNATIARWQWEMVNAMEWQER